MNTKGFLLALTAWLAEGLDLTIDEEIFAGNVPETKSEGVGVLLSARDITAELNLATFQIQILGKFLTPEGAWDLQDKVATLLPKYGIEIGTEEETGVFLLSAIIPDATGNAPFRSADRGRTVWCASINTRAAVYYIDE